MFLLISEINPELLLIVDGSKRRIRRRRIPIPLLEMSQPHPSSKPALLLDQERQQYLSLVLGHKGASNSTAVACLHNIYGRDLHVSQSATNVIYYFLDNFIHLALWEISQAAIMCKILATLILLVAPHTSHLPAWFDPGNPPSTCTLLP